MKPLSPAKITLKNIYKFVQGWMRYILLQITNIKERKDLNSSLKLLSNEKIEQYKWRLTKTNPECITNKACIICGCKVPQLQMTNAACEGNCYPKMMNAEEWKEFKILNNINI